MRRKRCNLCGELFDPQEEMMKHDTNGWYCYECFEEEYESRCPLCDEWFEDAEFSEPGKFHFGLSKELAEYQHMQPGIYRADEFPFYRSCIMGSDDIFEDCVTKVAELPDDWDSERCDQICGDCIRGYFLPFQQREFLKEMNT